MFEAISKLIVENRLKLEQCDVQIDYQVKKAIVFKGLFPISITSVPFDATVTDQEYFTANVVFKYHNYMITDTNFNELWFTS